MFLHCILDYKSAEKSFKIQNDKCPFHGNTVLFYITDTRADYVKSPVMVKDSYVDFHKTSICQMLLMFLLVVLLLVVCMCVVLWGEGDIHVETTRQLQEVISLLPVWFLEEN